MSILKSKHSGWTWDMKRTPYGGGPSAAPAPAPQPTTTNVQNTNIPEYARPYVETMLGATQQQLFNTTQNADGSTQITGVKPYVPYSQNPQDYIAGFSPMQQAAQEATANLQTPGQFGAATNMTGMGGLGTLGTAMQESQAGNRYNQMATNPYATQAFMSPYIQAALQPQLQEMQRQYGITGAQEQSAATQAGAFGGSREALMAAENQRNKNIAMNQAIGSGYQNAFQAAQQAQQFGANLGLQGQQAAQAGYGQLGQLGGQMAGIGGQQLGAQQSIIAAQSQAGGQQQQQQQNIINQAIQNYATAQQYPQQQLSFMNAMLRGLPTQQTTTNAYQATPSSLNQITGAGLAGLGAYQAFR